MIALAIIDVKVRYLSSNSPPPLSSPLKGEEMGKD